MGTESRQRTGWGVAVMDIALSILGFIAVLAVLILVHEGGHFMAAKAAGIRVLEFGLGFPPRLWGVHRGDTLYSINAIPLGGFVKMAGEEDPTEPRSLASKSAGVRFLVMAAGAFMNALTALVLFSALFVVPQDVLVGKVTIAEVAADSPAQKAGVLPGDTIVSVNGHAVLNVGDLRYRVNLDLGQQSTWLIQRGEQSLTVNLVPRLNPPADQGATGIVLATSEYHVERQSEALWKAPFLGLQRMGEVLILTRNEFAKWIAGGTAPQVTGPVGMAQAFGEVAQEQSVAVGDRIMAIVSLAAIISMSLAIFNILPIPALDGGRILFVVIEMVRRGKRIPPEKEGMVHFIGFVVLIALALVITFADLSRILHGGSVLGG